MVGLVVGSDDIHLDNHAAQVQAHAGQLHVL
jgi:hypothetical protein